LNDAKLLFAQVAGLYISTEALYFSMTAFLRQLNHLSHWLIVSSKDTDGVRNTD